MKKTKKERSGSVKVDPPILESAKVYCKQNGILVSFYVTEAIREKLKKDKHEE